MLSDVVANANLGTDFTHLLSVDRVKIFKPHCSVYQLAPDKFGVAPTLGNVVWDWQEALGQFSDPEFAQKGQLTVTYLTDAHRKASALIVHSGAMRGVTACGSAPPRESSSDVRSRRGRRAVSRWASDRMA